MHDEILMRVPHGVADRAEDAEPLLDAQSMPVTVLRQRRSLDELQREIRPSVRRFADVEQVRDVGMV